MIRPLATIVIASLALAAACGKAAPSGTGGQNQGGGGGGAPALAVVYGAPALPTKEPDADDHAVEGGYVTAVAANGGLVAIGTTTAVLAVGADGLTPLEIVGDGSVPASTGAVRAMAAYGAGALVAAEAGLFFTEGSVVQVSLANDALGPLGITAMTARVVPPEDGGPADTHLAVLGADGAYEIAGGQKAKWTVSGEAGLPTAFFAQETRAFLAFGRRVYEIDKAAKEARPLAFDVGEVHAIACGSLACDEGSRIYFATDAGLVERGADGVYRRFPLAAEGASGVAVDGFAVDAAKQRLYAVAGTQVLRVRAGEVPEAVATIAPPGDHPRRAAIDKSGDLWLGEALTLRRLAIGTPLSFATDVRPVLHAYCAACHATGQQGAPVVDFESYDVASARIAEILMRIQTQSMPPPSFGQKVPKETIQLLTDWSASKAP